MGILKGDTKSVDNGSYRVTLGLLRRDPQGRSKHRRKENL